MLMYLDIITILHFFCTIIEVLAVERLMGVFFQKRKTKLPVVICSYLLFSVGSLLVAMFLLDAIPNTLSIAIGVTLILVITLNYESSVKRRIIAIASIVVLSYVTAIFAATFVIFVPVFSGVYEKNVFQIFSCLLLYLVALVLRRLRHIKNNAVVFPRFWIFILIVPILTSLMVFFYTIDLDAVGSIFLGSILLTANVIPFYLFDALSASYGEKMKSALHSQEKEYYLAQCHLMQESMDEAKSIRHDMKTHFATLKGYVADNEMAANYLNRLLGDIEESKIYADTGNIAFDSIINFKLRNAKENNINVDIKTLIPLSLDVEVADIVTILGNLLDNALDAVAKVEDKMIKLDIEYSKSSLFIQIENTFDGEIRYTEKKKGEESIIASLKGGNEHGHGLKNVRKSVEKYDGHIDITHGENIFSVGVFLYVDDEELPAST